MRSAITPPPDVLDAFKDVSSARGDRETLALAAEAYASKRLPQVRGAAAEEMEAAKAFAADCAAHAVGDVSRFQELLQAKRAAPRAIQAQLWLETARTVGQQVDVLPLSEGTEVRVAPDPLRMFGGSEGPTDGLTPEKFPEVAAV